jgi:hypothetical protein
MSFVVRQSVIVVFDILRVIKTLLLLLRYNSDTQLVILCHNFEIEWVTDKIDFIVLVES